MKVRSMLAIAMSDFKDLRRNMSILPLIFIPPLLALLMGKISGQQAPLHETLPIWIVYGQILVGMSIMALSLAEEKEKKTLEALLVSPATLADIIGAKIGFTVVVTLAVEALTIAVGGGIVGNLGVLLAASVIGTVFFTLVGLAIGVFSPNQKAAGALSTPFMLLFLLGPMVISLSKVLKRFIDYLPSLNILELLKAGMLKEDILAGHLKDVVSIAVWTAAATAFGIWALKRQQRQ